MARRRPPRQKPTDSSRVVRWAGLAEARKDLLIAIGLGILAFAHRALFLVGNRDRDWPFTIFYFGDTRIFFDHALAMLRGELHDQGIPLRPPLFPRILATVYSLAGADPATNTVPHFEVRQIFAAIAALGVALLYLLARPYLGRFGAVLATLPWVWHFGGYVMAVAPVVEGTYLTVLLAVLLLFTRRTESVVATSEVVSHRVWAVVLGVGIGVLHLLRAEAVVLGMLVIAACLVRPSPPSLRLRIVPAVLVLAGWGLALLPSTIIHHRALVAANQRLQLAEPLPVWVPVAIYGGLNLALANHPDASGRFSPALLVRHGSQGRLDLEQPDQLHLVLHGTSEAWRFAREQPREALVLATKKLALAARACSLGWGLRNWPGGLSGQREPVDVFTPDRRTAAWLWLPLAAVGAIACWLAGPRSRKWLGIVGLVSVPPLMAVVLFFGYTRQFLLALPLWLGLAGVGVGAIVQVIAARLESGAWQRPDWGALGDRRASWLVLGSLVVAVLTVDVVLSRAPVDFLATGSVEGPRNTIVQDAAVRLEPRVQATP